MRLKYMYVRLNLFTDCPCHSRDPTVSTNPLQNRTNSKSDQLFIRSKSIP